MKCSNILLVVILALCGCGGRESKPLAETEIDFFKEEVVSMFKRGKIDSNKLAVLLNISFEIDSVRSCIPVPDVEARIDFRTNPTWATNL